MGLLNAFAGNPQFQQQLGSIMNGQGPGMSAPQFTPPPMQMNTSVAPQRTGVGMSRFGMGGAIDPLSNYGGRMGDPLQMLMQRMGPMAY